MITEQLDTYSMESLPEKETTSIANAINRFLESISLENRVIFMRRYWFCDTCAEIAARYGISERKVKRQIQETREQMCDYLGRTWGSFGINHVEAKFVREAEAAVSLKEDRNLYHFSSLLLDLIDIMVRIYFHLPKQV